MSQPWKVGGLPGRLIFLICALAATVTAADPVAAELAHRADQARDHGQVVRAYLLYSQAAVRDPGNPRYRAERDAVAPAAKLIAKTDVGDADIAADLSQAEGVENRKEPPVELVRRIDWEGQPDLQPIPRLEPDNKVVDFDLRGDERSLYQEVTAAYGIRTTFDPQLDVRKDLHFTISQADFRTAMQALTAATETFLFPSSNKHIFVARNTEEKRGQFEPQVVLTFPLPDAIDQKDLVEAANAVRTLLNMRTVGWDSTTRTVMVRDRATRARVSLELLQALLLPHSEVMLEVQLLTVDSERSYHYGLALPTSYQLGYIGQFGGLKSLPSNLGNSLTLLTLGGGSSIFGLALASSTFFANFTDSYSHNLYDATVRVSAGQVANFHVGDQYPIAQSLYTGFAQSTPSIYTPAPQITMVDLGLVLKMSPRVGGDGNIALDVEASYKALGNQTFNTVPSILQRQFKGSVTLREGEAAIIAGLDSDTESVSRNGLIGLSQIPGINQVLSENSRDRQRSQTLVVIKPTVIRLPMSAAISPQFLLGPQRGETVLF